MPVTTWPVGTSEPGLPIDVGVRFSVHVAIDPTNTRATTRRMTTRVRLEWVLGTALQLPGRRHGVKMKELISRDRQCFPSVSP
jgi:hypothetical protein